MNSVVFRQPRKLLRRLAQQGYEVHAADGRVLAPEEDVLALAQVEELTDKAFFENNMEAFNLAVKAEEYIPNDQSMVFISISGWYRNTVSIHQ